MLEVGWPDPALVEERIESTRSCAARSATTSSDTSFVSPAVVMADFLPMGWRSMRAHERQALLLGSHRRYGGGPRGGGGRRPPARRPPQRHGGWLVPQ